MKSILKKVAGVAITAVLALGMSACANDSDSHEHTFAETYTSNETHHWYAATCGHTDQKKDQAEHTWNHEDYQYDSESGKEIRTCTECSYVDDQEHQHETTADLSKDQTNHWKVCDVCGGNYEVTAHTEDTGTVTTVPSCTEKGVKTYKCADCEEVLRTEEVAALGHTEDEGTVTTAVTLTSDGVRTYRCKSCDFELRTEVITKPVLYETPVDAETRLAATSSSTYIYFGVFPKTVLPTDSTVTIDENVSVTMGANTYYSGSDGNYYAKVKENCYGSSGYTYTDGTTVKKSEADSNRYFKVEPVKWKVLTTNYNGKALLLAEDILTANVPYYVTTGDRTISESTVYANNYKYSTIRAYLNGKKYETYDTQDKTAFENKGFLQTAFTATAQSKIAETEVDNSGDSTTDATGTLPKADGSATDDSGSHYPDYTCESTEDKIFLLSEKEVTTNAYGFAAYNSSGKGNARIRFPTDYAKANYAYQSTTDGYGGLWWLRSPFYSSYSFARHVVSNGSANDDDRISEERYGVVPALSISF